MYKSKHFNGDHQPSHDYNTRLKNNNNLIVPLNHINFGDQSTHFKGVLFLYVNILI